MRTRATIQSHTLEMRPASESRLLYKSPTTWANGGLCIFGQFSATAPTTVILDQAIDWRDRLLLISSFIEEPPNEAIPGSNQDHFLYPRPRAAPGNTGQSLNGQSFYTYLGWTGNLADGRGGANRYNFAQWIKNTDGTLSTVAYLYADRGTGQLAVLLTGGLVVAGAFTIIASEQLNVRIPLP